MLIAITHATCAPAGWGTSSQIAIINTCTGAVAASARVISAARSAGDTAERIALAVIGRAARNLRRPRCRIRCDAKATGCTQSREQEQWAPVAPHGQR